MNSSDWLILIVDKRIIRVVKYFMDKWRGKEGNLLHGFWKVG